VPITFYYIGKLTNAFCTAEHVFEGQLIGDFFTQWLDKGKVKNQFPSPAITFLKAPCSWSRKWITRTTTNSPWKCKTSAGGSSRCTFAEYIIKELGNKENLDRLTIYGSRLNRKKGTVSFHH
jgi:chitinase